MTISPHPGHDSLHQHFLLTCSFYGKRSAHAHGGGSQREELQANSKHQQKVKEGFLKAGGGKGASEELWVVCFYGLL